MSKKKNLINKRSVIGSLLVIAVLPFVAMLSVQAVVIDPVNVCDRDPDSFGFGSCTAVGYSSNDVIREYRPSWEVPARAVELDAEGRRFQVVPFIFGPTTDI